LNSEFGLGRPFHAFADFREHIVIQMLSAQFKKTADILLDIDVSLKIDITKNHREISPKVSLVNSSMFFTSLRVFIFYHFPPTSKSGKSSPKLHNVRGKEERR